MAVDHRQGDEAQHVRNLEEALEDLLEAAMVAAGKMNEAVRTLEEAFARLQERSRKMLSL